MQETAPIAVYIARKSLVQVFKRVVKSAMKSIRKSSGLDIVIDLPKASNSQLALIKIRCAEGCNVPMSPTFHACRITFHSISQIFLAFPVLGSMNIGEQEEQMWDM
ncbi:hypothetical protein NN561_006891 [Cricetulus griseus]